MRTIKKSVTSKTIDDEKKVTPTICDVAICCCKCIYRKSLYGKTKFGERIFYAYCCTNLAKSAGVVLIIKDHDTCTNFAAVTHIAGLLKKEPEVIPPPVAICSIENYSCFDYGRTVDSCGICMATAYPDCPHRRYSRSSGRDRETQK